jgi:hypothetical protein
MREKSRAHRRIEKILIRTTKNEKNIAEKLSKDEGENTSQFFRRLLKQESERESFDAFMRAAEKLEKITGELSGIIDKVKQSPSN